MKNNNTISFGLIIIVFLALFLSSITKGQTSQLTIIDNPSPNYDSREGTTIDRLVIHYTAGGLQSTLDTFSNPDSKVSAHYVLNRDGTVYRVVNEDNSAWHARSFNKRSIGIEVVNYGFDCQKLGGTNCQSYGNDGRTWEPYPSMQIRVLAKLAAEIIRRNPNILPDREHIIGHYQVPDNGGKEDPGPLFPWSTFMDEVIQELNILGPLPTTTNPSSTQPGQTPTPSTTIPKYKYTIQITSGKCSDTSIHTTSTIAPTITPTTSTVPSSSHFIWPLDDHHLITSCFGYRAIIIGGTRHYEFHSGIDMAAYGGTEIKAAASGKVIFVGSNGDWGNSIYIQHNFQGTTLYTLYGHIKCGGFLVHVGDTVTTGQVIGLSGGADACKGRSTGGHLHFEVRKDPRLIADYNNDYNEYIKTSVHPCQYLDHCAC